MIVSINFHTYTYACIFLLGSANKDLLYLLILFPQIWLNIALKHSFWYLFTPSPPSQLHPHRPPHPFPTKTQKTNTRRNPLNGILIFCPVVFLSLEQPFCHLPFRHITHIFISGIGSKNIIKNPILYSFILLSVKTLIHAIWRTVFNQPWSTQSV